MHGVRGGWQKTRSPRKKVKRDLASEESPRKKVKLHLASEESENGRNKVTELLRERESEWRRVMEPEITIEYQLSAQILEDTQLNGQ